MSAATVGPGNARFRGRVDLPASCTDEPEDIAFLIRIADVSNPNSAGLIDLWNAFGAARALRPAALKTTDQD
jgi:hypothetical protein